MQLHYASNIAERVNSWVDLRGVQFQQFFQALNGIFIYFYFDLILV